MSTEPVAASSRLEVRVCVAADAATATAWCATQVAKTVRAAPLGVLGLSTGRTMISVYDRLAALHRDEGLVLSGLTTFNLDEYLGLAPDHPGAFRQYILDKLVTQTDLPAEALNLPASDPEDPDAEAARFEAAIAAAGGIDLQLLGLGANGHVAFNEPGSAATSRTRVVTLSEQTRADNAATFPAGKAVPAQAITMGIATVMNARRLLVLATGAHKAAAVKALLEGPVSTQWLCSFLRAHPDLTVILDAEAAVQVMQRRSPPAKDFSE